MAETIAARLAAIEARLKATTPGEWEARHHCVDRTEFDDEDCGLGLEIVGPEEPGLRGQFARSADALFIVQAHNADIAWLLSTVRELAVLLAWETNRIGRRPMLEWFGLSDTIDDFHKLRRKRNEYWELGVAMATEGKP